MMSEDACMAVIDSDEVGVFAAHLLTTKDVGVHNKAKYILNGPKDITGRLIVDLVEEQLGTKVENVSFKDVSFVK
jgi:uncharacterized protein YbjT (DUF2867 family)